MHCAGATGALGLPATSMGIGIIAAVHRVDMVDMVVCVRVFMLLPLESLNQTVVITVY